MGLVRVKCKLDDCAYYHAVKENNDECDCSHPDKSYYMKNPCPLYRKDWQRSKVDKAEEIRAKIMKKRKL